MLAGNSPELILYSRFACHLCDDMLHTLQDFSTDMRFTVTVVDIDNDHSLSLRYNEAVPLLTCAGAEVCRHFFDLDALKQALAAVHGES